MENPIVRENMMEDKNYTPYCGAKFCSKNMPRTFWNGSQMECRCGWVSKFPDDFIKNYKNKHFTNFTLSN